MDNMNKEIWEDSNFADNQYKNVQRMPKYKPLFSMFFVKLKSLIILFIAIPTLSAIIDIYIIPKYDLINQKETLGTFKKTKGNLSYKRIEDSDSEDQAGSDVHLEYTYKVGNKKYRSNTVCISSQKYVPKKNLNYIRNLSTNKSFDVYYNPQAPEISALFKHAIVDLNQAFFFWISLVTAILFILCYINQNNYKSSINNFLCKVHNKSPINEFPGWGFINMTPSGIEIAPVVTLNKRIKFFLGGAVLGMIAIQLLYLLFTKAFGFTYLQTKLFAIIFVEASFIPGIFMSRVTSKSSKLSFDYSRETLDISKNGFIYHTFNFDDIAAWSYEHVDSGVRINNVAKFNYEIYLFIDDTVSGKIPVATIPFMLGNEKDFQSLYIPAMIDILADIPAYKPLEVCARPHQSATKKRILA